MYLLLLLLIIIIIIIIPRGWAPHGEQRQEPCLATGERGREQPVGASAVVVVQMHVLIHIYIYIYACIYIYIYIYNVYIYIYMYICVYYIISYCSPEALRLRLGGWIAPRTWGRANVHGIRMLFVLKQ